MGILPASAAQALAGTIEQALPDRAAIVRVTRTQDTTTGGWSASEAVFASGIPCRVDKSGLTPRERAIAERYGSVQVVRISLSAKATRWPGGVIDVRASDAIVVVGDGAGNYEAAEDGGPVTDELLRELVAVKIT